MRRTAIAVFMMGLVAGAGTSALADRTDGDMVAVERGWYRKVVEQLLKDADSLEEKNEDNPDKNSRKAVREVLVAMRKDLVAMRADLEKAPFARPAGDVIAEIPPTLHVPPPTLATTPIVTPAGPIPLTDGEFSDLLKAIKKASYSSDKLALVKDVAAIGWFTVDQVAKVMQEFSYSNEKVQAGATLYPRVVDKQNWFKVYSSLTYSSDRDKLRKLTSGTAP